MTKSLKVVGRDVESTTSFGDVVAALSAEKGWNQRSLAVEVGCSPSTLSLVGAGERGLSDTLATAFSVKLGGTPEIWSKIYDHTRSGALQPISHFRAMIVGSGPIDDFDGSRVRRLRKRHFEKLLLLPELDNSNTEAREVFRVDPYNPENADTTSYDTTIGSVREYNSDVNVPIEGVYLLDSMKSVLITTREAVTLPKWMEADVHAATSLAKKHLIVSGGPIIDPGFDNFLCAAIFNPTPEPVKITTEEPFLTLRFWIQEV